MGQVRRIAKYFRGSSHIHFPKSRLAPVASVYVRIETIISSMTQYVYIWMWHSKGFVMKRIAVLGLGKVGHLAAQLLHDLGLEVIGVDQLAQDDDTSFKIEKVDVSHDADVLKIFNSVDAVLSCLPYQLNIGLAKLAYQAKIHYFDLTEDVETTKAIQTMGETSAGLMAPQCGLAPGFVGIVGASQISEFDTVRNCKMRIGALPQHPTGHLGYAFNWSPAGVVNEYLNDSEVIENGVKKTVSSMEWHETIIIDGLQLEAFTTSGGLGTMCDTYLGKVDELNYKSIRYPGHMEMMNFFFHELLMREDRDRASDILTHAKPPVSEDVVYAHISTEGEVNGATQRKEFVRAYKPIMINGELKTAIAWTTAASVVAVIEMVQKKLLPQSGFLKQEDIPLDDFFSTNTGRLYSENGKI